MNLLALILLLLANLIGCALSQSPLKGKNLFVNPAYRRKVDATISKLAAGTPDHDKILKNLKIVRNSSTVIWLNSAAQVQPNNTDIEAMATILAEACKKPNSAVVFAINSIPKDNCVEKLEVYKHSFIDGIVNLTKKYRAKVSIAFIVEANAVASMVTDGPSCGDAAIQKTVWKDAVSYAVTQLNTNAPDSPLYLGLGHSGWLGTDQKSKSAADIITSWGVANKIRGFATNIGNFKPVGTACPAALYCVPGKNHESDPCCTNPCETKAIYSDNSEMNFALRMEKFFPGKKFVIDTGKNGISNARSTCDSWCNARNGLGLRPSGSTRSPLVDAYLWIKPPGETNGCTQVLPTGDTCPSFQAACASVDAVGSAKGEPRMPVNGQWSDFYITLLAKNANFDNVDVLPFANKTISK